MDIIFSNLKREFAMRIEHVLAILLYLVKGLRYQY